MSAVQQNKAQNANLIAMLSNIAEDLETVDIDELMPTLKSTLKILVTEKMIQNYAKGKEVICILRLLHRFINESMACERLLEPQLVCTLISHLLVILGKTNVSQSYPKVLECLVALAPHLDGVSAATLNLLQLSLAQMQRRVLQIFMQDANGTYDSTTTRKLSVLHELDALNTVTSCEEAKGTANEKKTDAMDTDTHPHNTCATDDVSLDNNAYSTFKMGYIKFEDPYDLMPVLVGTLYMQKHLLLRCTAGSGWQHTAWQSSVNVELLLSLIEINDLSVQTYATQVLALVFHFSDVSVPLLDHVLCVLTNTMHYLSQGPLVDTQYFSPHVSPESHARALVAALKLTFHMAVDEQTSDLYVRDIATVCKHLCYSKHATLDLVHNILVFVVGMSSLVPTYSPLFSWLVPLTAQHPHHHPILQRFLAAQATRASYVTVTSTQPAGSSRVHVHISRAVSSAHTSWNASLHDSAQSNHGGPKHGHQERADDEQHRNTYVQHTQSRQVDVIDLSGHADASVHVSKKKRVGPGTGCGNKVGREGGHDGLAVGGVCQTVGGERCARVVVQCFDDCIGEGVCRRLREIVAQCKAKQMKQEAFCQSISFIQTLLSATSKQQHVIHLHLTRALLQLAESLSDMVHNNNTESGALQGQGAPGASVGLTRDNVTVSNTLYVIHEVGWVLQQWAGVPRAVQAACAELCGAQGHDARARGSGQLGDGEQSKLECYVQQQKQYYELLSGQACDVQEWWKQMVTYTLRPTLNLLTTSLKSVSLPIKDAKHTAQQAQSATTCVALTMHTHTQLLIAASILAGQWTLIPQEHFNWCVKTCVALQKQCQQAGFVQAATIARDSLYVLAATTTWARNLQVDNSEEGSKFIIQLSKQVQEYSMAGRGHLLTHNTQYVQHQQHQQQQTQSCALHNYLNYIMRYVTHPMPLLCMLASYMTATRQQAVHQQAHSTVQHTTATPRVSEVPPTGAQSHYGGFPDMSRLGSVACSSVWCLDGGSGSWIRSVALSRQHGSREENGQSQARLQQESQKLGLEGQECKRDGDGVVDFAAGKVAINEALRTMHGEQVAKTLNILTFCLVANTANKSHRSSADSSNPPITPPPITVQQLATYALSRLGDNHSAVSHAAYMCLCSIVIASSSAAVTEQDALLVGSGVSESGSAAQQRVDVAGVSGEDMQFVFSIIKDFLDEEDVSDIHKVAAIQIPRHCSPHLCRSTTELPALKLVCTALYNGVILNSPEIKGACIDALSYMARQCSPNPKAIDHDSTKYFVRPLDVKWLIAIASWAYKCPKVLDCIEQGVKMSVSKLLQQSSQWIMGALTAGCDAQQLTYPSSMLSITPSTLINSHEGEVRAYCMWSKNGGQATLKSLHELLKMYPADSASGDTTGTGGAGSSTGGGAYATDYATKAVKFAYDQAWKSKHQEHNHIAHQLVDRLNQIFTETAPWTSMGTPSTFGSKPSHSVLDKRRCIAILLHIGRYFSPNAQPHAVVQQSTQIVVKQSASISDAQVSALRAIEVLCLTLDKDIIEHCPLVYTQLCAAIKSDNISVQHAALHAWRTFLQMLQNTQHWTFIVQILIPLSVMFYSLAESSPSLGPIAISTLCALIKENRIYPKVADKLKDMPPIPTTPVFDELRRILHRDNTKQAPTQAAQSKTQQTLPQTTLQHKLQQYLWFMGQKQEDVRCFALERVRDLLNTQRDQVHLLCDFAVGNKRHVGDGRVGKSEGARRGRGGSCAEKETVEKLLGGIIGNLNKTAKTPKIQSMMATAAECLGLIGAIAPDRVSVTLPTRQPLSSNHIDFMVQLIQDHIIRILLSSTDFDCVSLAMYALQHILESHSTVEMLHTKFDEEDMTLDEVVQSQMLKYRVKANPEQTARYDQYAINTSLYDCLPKDVKVVVQPYRSTQYVTHPRQDVCGTEYVYSRKKSYRQWLTDWVKLLISKVVGPHQNAFICVWGLLKYDVDLLLFLLPYVVVVRVMEGGAQSIANEMRHVIQEGAAGLKTHHELDLHVQSIFILLDQLSSWLHNMPYRHPKSSPILSLTTNKVSPHHLPQHIHALLLSIPLTQLSLAASNIGAHARALQYYEQQLRDKYGAGLNPSADKVQVYPLACVNQLRDCYYNLQDEDGLVGLRHVMEYQCVGGDGVGGDKWGDGGEDGLKGLKKGVTDMQGPHTSMDISSAWRVGDWDAVSDQLQQIRSNQITERGGNYLQLSQAIESDQQVAHLLLLVRNKEFESFKHAAYLYRYNTMQAVAAAGMESYDRVYPQMVRLQLISELSDVCQEMESMHMIHGGAATNAPGTLSEGGVTIPASSSPLQDNEQAFNVAWRHHNRIPLTLMSVLVRDQLLAVQRTCGTLTGRTSQVSEGWIQYSKVLRKLGHLQQAGQAAQQATLSGHTSGVHQQVKVLWMQGKLSQALTLIQQQLPPEKEETSDQGRSKGFKRKSFGQSEVGRNQINLKLARARIIAGAGYQDSKGIRSLFENTIKDNVWHGNAYLYYARYLDGVYNHTRGTSIAIEKGLLERQGTRHKNRQRIKLGYEEDWQDMLPLVIQQYGKAISCGCRTPYQTLTRLFTVFFDYCSELNARASKSDSEASKANQRIGKCVERMRNALDVQRGLSFRTILPGIAQLISRICHPVKEVRDFTQNLVSQLVVKYPYQGLWHLAAVAKSEVPGRRSAATAVLLQVRENSSARVTSLTQAHTLLCDQLHKVVHFKPVDRDRRAPVQKLSARKTFSMLVRALPLEVLIPFEQFMRQANEVSRSKNTADVVTINSVQDEITVLSSLQKPKKIVFIGSDGEGYSFLAKPQDDLRKDARMMEVAAVLNALLAKHPQAARRDMYVRTFQVVPLNERTGILEWVPNTRGLRHCLGDVYQSHGVLDQRKGMSSIKSKYDIMGASMRAEWLRKILKDVPPMMHAWMLASFNEPATWVKARQRWCHTCSVWSMFGHMVGLGDRHGENILIDTMNGDAVHVDFSCLFDKGITLEVPEVVPFRLTQNIIDGFGVIGVEGSFRNSAEITLKILREKRANVVDVIEALLYDPLVDWSAGTSQQHGSNASDKTMAPDNPMGKDSLQTVRGRLEGTLLGVHQIPVSSTSVEGQVENLIAAATSIENLSRMYIWWMPWF